MYPDQMGRQQISSYWCLLPIRCKVRGVAKKWFVNSGWCNWQGALACVPLASRVEFQSGWLLVQSSVVA